MAPTGYQNLSITTEARNDFNLLIVAIADGLGQPLNRSEVIRVATEYVLGGRDADGQAAFRADIRHAARAAGVIV